MKTTTSCPALPHPTAWCRATGRDPLAAKCANVPVWSNPIRHWKVQ